MVDRQKTRRIKITRRESAEPMSVHDMQTAETILARLVARAFAVDHPELFGQRLPREIGESINEQQ